VGIEGEIGQDLSRAFGGANNAKALHIEQCRETFVRRSALDQRQMCCDHESTRREKGDLICPQGIGMEKRLRRAKRSRPSIGRELGVLLLAKVPIRQLNVMEFGGFRRLRYAPSRAKIGNSLAVVARFFLPGREGEVINSPRRFNWQKRACVNFGKNRLAPVVLNHAEPLGCHLARSP
jgi:hypothetical protein